VEIGRQEIKRKKSKGREKIREEERKKVKEEKNIPSKPF
jgi:hypothetical protein